MFALRYKISGKVYLVVFVILLVALWYIFLVPTKYDGNKYVDYWYQMNNKSFVFELNERYAVLDLIDPRYSYSFNPKDPSAFLRLVSDIEPFKVDFFSQSSVSHYAIGSDTIAYLTDLEPPGKIYVDLHKVKVMDFFVVDVFSNIPVSGEKYSVTILDEEVGSSIYISVEGGYVKQFSFF